MLSLVKSYLRKTARKVITRKTKGEINYFLAILMGTAVLVIIAWPRISGIATTMWTSLTTWVSSNQAKIFTNLP